VIPRTLISVHRLPVILGSLLAAACAGQSARAAPPDAAPVNYQKIAPLLTKYCVGCHNDTDREGKLSLASYEALRRGGQKGSVITPGQPESSRLIRVLTGKAEPKMPPEGEAAPSKEEIQFIADWIAAGAHGPTGQAGDLPLVTPAIPVKVPPKLAVHALAIDPTGTRLAVGLTTGSSWWCRRTSPW
jgi:mono/diheme cytochrome c family protein